MLEWEAAQAPASPVDFLRLFSTQDVFAPRLYLLTVPCLLPRPLAYPLTSPLTPLLAFPLTLSHYPAVNCYHSVSPLTHRCLVCFLLRKQANLETTVVETKMLKVGAVTSLVYVW